MTFAPQSPKQETDNSEQFLKPDTNQYGATDQIQDNELSSITHRTSTHVFEIQHGSPEPPPITYPESFIM